MEVFSDVFELCELSNLGFTGLPYTFDLIGATTSSWRDIFFNALVKHLTSPCNDCCPLLIVREVDVDIRPKDHCHRYEIMWRLASPSYCIISGKRQGRSNLLVISMLH